MPITDNYISFRFQMQNKQTAYQTLFKQKFILNFKIRFLIVNFIITARSLLNRKINKCRLVE